MITYQNIPIIETYLILTPVAWEGCSNEEASSWKTPTVAPSSSPRLKKETAKKHQRRAYMVNAFRLPPISLTSNNNFCQGVWEFRQRGSGGCQEEMPMNYKAYLHGTWHLTYHSTIIGCDTMNMLTFKDLKVDQKGSTAKLRMCGLTSIHKLC
jgi:hypothetical protein